MALSDDEVDKQVGILSRWMEIVGILAFCLSLQINQMKKFIEQEAREKADEIMVKVSEL